MFKKTVGSRAEVWHGTAKKTSGGLMKKDLKMNKRGRIVSKKMSNRAKKEKRLEKAGYKTKKGVFKKFKAKKRGGENSNNETNEATGKAYEKKNANNKYNKKKREKILFEQAMRSGWHAPTIITSFLPDENLLRLAESGKTSLGRIGSIMFYSSSIKAIARSPFI